MINILIFISNIIIQSIMFNCIMIITSQLFTKRNSSKKQIIFSFVSSLLAIMLIEFLKNTIPLINVLISAIWMIIVNLFILKNSLSKALLVTITVLLEIAVFELITAFLGMLIFKNEVANITMSNQKIILLSIQCVISILIMSIIYFIISKKNIFNDFVEKLSYKQIIIFACTLMIYFMPTILLFIINKFKYPPIFFLINAIQFAIICIFLFSYLKKSMENEKSQSDLFTSELHNKTLIGMVDGVRTLKHDYNNIMQSLNGYVSTKQYDKLQEHINSVLKECNVVNNLSVIDPKIFNEPAIYGIVGSKFFLANEADITFDFDVTSDIASIPFPMPDLSRILGILLDNAIEATKKAPTQYVRLEFKYDNRKNADVIKVINTYDTNIKINLTDIYKKGFSTKEVKSGIGLWEVKKLIAKNYNSQIFAETDGNKFIQNIIIER